MTVIKRHEPWVHKAASLSLTSLSSLPLKSKYKLSTSALLYWEASVTGIEREVQTSQQEGKACHFATPLPNSP